VERDATMEPQAPTSGAEASGGEVTVEASTNADQTPEEQVQLPDGEFVPKAVMEAHLKERERHFQSVADRQVAQAKKELDELRARLASPVQADAPQTNGMPQQSGSDFDNAKFMEMLDEDPAKAREYFFSHPQNAPAQPIDVQSQVQQVLEQERQQAAYVASVEKTFEGIGMTPEERERAEQYIANQYQSTGSYIDPNIAAMVGRFGSPEQAVSLANAQLMAMSQQAPQPEQNRQQPAMVAGPGLPGGGLPNKPEQPQPRPAGGPQAGTYRDVLG